MPGGTSISPNTASFDAAMDGVGDGADFSAPANLLVRAFVSEGGADGRSPARVAFSTGFAGTTEDAASGVGAVVLATSTGKIGDASVMAPTAFIPDKAGGGTGVAASGVGAVVLATSTGNIGDASVMAPTAFIPDKAGGGTGVAVSGVGAVVLATSTGNIGDASVMAPTAFIPDKAGGGTGVAGVEKAGGRDGGVTTGASGAALLSARAFSTNGRSVFVVSCMDRGAMTGSGEKAGGNGVEAAGSAGTEEEMILPECRMGGVAFTPEAVFLASDLSNIDTTAFFVSSDLGSGESGIGGGAGGVTTIGCGSGSVGGAGGRFAKTSLTVSQFSIPSRLARSEADTRPSARYCRTCFSE